ncbi:MAG: MFS transporter [Sphingomonadales bacterium]|jgi:MFS family permease
MAEQREKAHAEFKHKVGGAYAYYVLFVLTLVYIFNFLDRQILSILITDIKADLGVGDAEMGFLYGTAFAVFYALFGIPMGRLADMWVRGRLMSLGLVLWSMMTALSGFAQNFSQLALARFGVGIGETTATPSAFSILGDYFPKEKRGTVLAVYSSGIYIGGGLALFGGAWVVEWWTTLYPIAEEAPFALAGWQAAFLAAGIPGLLLALLMLTVKEPVRGMAEGIVSEVEPKPFAKFWHELTSVIPPLTLWHLYKISSSRKVIGFNLLGATGVALLALILTQLIGNAPQWIALGIAVYAVISWGQALAIRDKPTFALIFQTRAFIWGAVGFGFIAFMGYSTGIWIAPYAEAVLGMPKTDVGLWVGSTATLSGWAGVIMGGILSDVWRKKTALGRLWLIMTAVVTPIPLFIVMFLTDDVRLFFMLFFPVNLLSTMWIGAAASTLQDLVLPRMRGAATAAYFLGTTIIGLGLGPYYVGVVSDAMGGLRSGLLAILAVVPIIVICLIMTSRHLKNAEDSRVERARAAGEAI